jgi:sugar O-acyltransferase (sialic acid O-acetyltransferase NeuD family)
MKDLIILGAGGAAAMMIDMIDDINKVNPEWRIVGFLDDNPNLINSTLSGYVVLGTIDEAYKWPNAFFTSSIAHPNNRLVRRKVYDRVKAQGGKFATLISPYAMVSKQAIIGEGCYISPMTRVCALAELKEDVYLASMCIVGHETVVGEHTTFAGNVKAAGSVLIGSDCYISTNVAIAHEVSIGGNTLVAIGSAVANNLKGGEMYIGVPAIPANKYSKLRLFINSLCKK